MKYNYCYNNFYPYHYHCNKHLYGMTNVGNLSSDIKIHSSYNKLGISGVYTGDCEDTKQHTLATTIAPVYRKFSAKNISANCGVRCYIYYIDTFKQKYIYKDLSPGQSWNPDGIYSFIAATVECTPFSNCTNCSNLNTKKEICKLSWNLSL